MVVFCRKFRGATSCLIAIISLSTSASDILNYTQPLREQPRLIKESLLNQEWSNFKPQLKAMISRSKNDSTQLYNAQLKNASFLRYATQTNHTQWVTELMETYGASYGTLITSSNYIFSYPVVKVGEKVTIPKQQVFPLSRLTKMWIHKEGTEEILSSSQFLLAITNLLRWSAENPKEKNNPIIQDFIFKYYNLALKDHYMRWVFGEDSPMGVIQVKAWGCNSGNFTFQQHFEHLIAKRYGTSYFPDFKPVEYCNMFRDVDIFVASGVMNILRANTLDANRFPLSASQKTSLTNFAKSFITLLRSRLVFSNATDFSGRNVQALNIDPEPSSYHREARFAGYTGTTYPGWTVLGTQNALPDKPSRNAGWDLSHARRFVYLTEILENVATRLNLISPSEVAKINVGLANTFAYLNFNKSLSNPKFANYFGGVNGWYRVNFADRPAFGYHPSDWRLGSVALPGGYAFWNAYNKDITSIILAAEKKMEYKTEYECLEVYAAMPEEFFTSGKRRMSNSGLSVCPK